MLTMSWPVPHSSAVKVTVYDDKDQLDRFMDAGPLGITSGTPGVNLANMTQAVCVISNTPVVPTAQGLTIRCAPQQDLLTSAHAPCQNLAANTYTCWCLRELRQSCP